MFDPERGRKLDSDNVVFSDIVRHSMPLRYDVGSVQLFTLSL